MAPNRVGIRGFLFKVVSMGQNKLLKVLVSQAWHNLSLKQKELYLYCIAQIEGNQPPLFTMNKNKWKNVYGLYTDCSQRNFYKDMKALIENGFIEVVRNGKQKSQNNIYKCVNKWQRFGKWCNIEGANNQNTVISKGYVYLVKMGNNYKIGIAKKPQSRLKEFTKLAEPLEEVCVKKVNNYKTVEEQLHAKYANKRLRGEWFKLTEKDIGAIIAYLSDIEIS